MHLASINDIPKAVFEDSLRVKIDQGFKEGQYIQQDVEQLRT